MNTRLKYIQYKGKSILYVDYRNLAVQDQQAAIELLDALANEMQSWTQRGLILSDFRGGKATPEFIAYAKKMGKEVFSGKVLRSACLGITGVQSILLQAYNTFANDKIVPFNTEEESKEWLIKD